MYKFHFNNKDTIHLDYPKGELLTKQSCALIQYEINENHHDVEINIDNMNFKIDDIDQFISFLTALNNKLKGL